MLTGWGWPHAPKVAIAVLVLDSAIFPKQLAWFGRGVRGEWQRHYANRWQFFLLWKYEGDWLYIDKVAHFVGHGAWVLLAYFVVLFGSSCYQLLGMTLSRAVLWGCVIGVGVEIHQRFFTFWKDWDIHNRGVSFKDLVADVAGIGVAVGAILLGGRC